MRHNRPALLNPAHMAALVGCLMLAGAVEAQSTPLVVGDCISRPPILHQAGKLGIGLMPMMIDVVGSDGYLVHFTTPDGSQPKQIISSTDIANFEKVECPK